MSAVPRGEGRGESEDEGGEEGQVTREEGRGVGWDGVGMKRSEMS